MNKKMVLVFIAMLFFSFTYLPKDVSADTLDFPIQEINENGFVSIDYLDELNNLNEITISKESIDTILRIQNNTYTVKHTSTGFYVASYKIDISSNKITKAHSSSITLSTGTLSNRSLIKLSETKARLSFNQKLLLGTLDRNITSTVSSDKISITVN